MARTIAEIEAEEKALAEEKKAALKEHKKSAVEQVKQLVLEYKLTKGDLRGKAMRQLLGE
ncbi:hypothetical protein N9D35_04235 [Gammaproteobacteria bacterium]|jgi:hypothetical protein|nr:hypothetical protein [Gammaproteobacteria bacterium]